MEKLLPKNTTEPIGRWGRLHLDYIRDFKPKMYTELLLTHQLCTHVSDVDQRAQSRFETIVSELQSACSLEEINDFEFLQQMNGIRSVAEEIVLNEIIYCR